MKKLLLLLAFAAFAACNTEEGSKDDAPQSTNFGGTLTVTSNKTPDAAPFTASDVHFELSGTDNKVILTMHEMRFAASMSMSLTISIPDLTPEIDKGITTFTSSVDPIVPYIGGKPYDKFQILDFKCVYMAGELNVSFTCRNPQIPVGGESLDHKAVYTGHILL